MLMKELKGKTMIVAADDVDTSVHNLSGDRMIDIRDKCEIYGSDNFYMVIDIPLLRQDKTKINRFNEVIADEDGYRDPDELDIADIVAGLAAQGFIPEGVDNLLIQG